MRLFKLIYITLIITIFNLGAQENKTYKIHTIAFYNLENLFDTINDPTKFDEKSPIMELQTNRSTIYRKKVKNMARVIADIGTYITGNSPAIIGVSEIENFEVLNDLVNDSLLLVKNYGIIHYDSPDYRGIDVALLYQKKLFTPTNNNRYELKIYDYKTKKQYFTRDQLVVTGKLDGETIHFIVNHWPSRRGGEAMSRQKRLAAAKLNKHLIDSLQSINPYAKIITMGDFNDNPTNASLLNVLNAKRNKNKVPDKGLFNPYINMFKKEGLGTTAYNDNWSLFDQILMTKPFLKKDFSSFRFYKAGIFNKTYLISKRGQYKGYPYRSFSISGFTDGFSDHFPVYVYLIKELKHS